MTKLKIMECFGGIGACSKALERLGIDYEIADYVEIDKYAVKSFNAIHNTNFEPQDICDWDKDIEVDLIMHGSPCQDFSTAGKQAGGDKDSGTRSSLMYETIRIVEKLKPKYVIWENVKNLLSKKHRHNFDDYLETMEQLGYTNYYQVLNAKDYGIPQNRERVFTVSILGNENYEFPKNECLTKMPIDYLEENIDEKYYLTEKNLEWLEEHNKNHKEKGTGFIFKPKNPNTDVANTIRANASWCPTDNAFFEFPPKQELKLKLKDMLEDEVDEKYYLSEEQINNIKTSTFHQNNRRIQEKEYCDTLCARDWKDPKCVDVTRKYGIFDTETSKHQAGSAYDENELSPTLDTMQGGWMQPCIEEKIVERIPLKFLNRNQKNIKGDYAFCVDSCNTGGIKEIKNNCLRIRKLTPKECWRLMGFDDEDFEKASKVNSNTQLYKQAGNSIVVNVLEAILTNLLK